MQAMREGWACNANDPAEPPADLKAFGWVMLAYALTLASLAATGSFILSATILFTVAVRAFVRGLWLKSALFGLLAGSVTYLLFSIVLGLQIGEGLPERALEWVVPF
ncbi:MAG: hypothetical protein JWS10_599 [Cypionkella sp.]|nr:hypothetical protein [Cypionkella sp.]